METKTRACTAVGCDKPHRARGLCSTHYNQRQPNRHRTQTLPCSLCGEPCTKDAGRDRRYAKLYCSYLCRDIDRAGGKYLCEVPPTHPSRASTIPPDHITMLLRHAISRPPTNGPRHCLWCDWVFTSTTPAQRYCGKPCKRRHKSARRRGREVAADGCYTKAELTNLFLLFDRRCAYCVRRLRVDEQPQPDHVVPLARNGSYAISNILPSCKACNSDKRDLLLTEWAEDRRRRGLPAVVTSWDPTDHRYRHLAARLA